MIGTRFGQRGTPAWYYNLRADPCAELRFGARTAAVVATELDGDEWQAAWDSGSRIYPGYQAYARRIRDRRVHIMLLTAPGTDEPAPHPVGGPQASRRDSHQ